MCDVPGYDEQLLADLGDKDVSIENSVAFRNGVVYFANSGGLVQGWDISDVLDGGTHVSARVPVLDGDDTDASIVIDDRGTCTSPASTSGSTSGASSSGS